MVARKIPTIKIHGNPIKNVLLRITRKDMVVLTLLTGVQTVLTENVQKSVMPYQKCTVKICRITCFLGLLVLEG